MIDIYFLKLLHNYQDVLDLEDGAPVPALEQPVLSLK